MHPLHRHLSPSPQVTRRRRGPITLPNKSLQRTGPPLGAIDRDSLLASINEPQRAGHRARPLSSRSLGRCAEALVTRALLLIMLLAVLGTGCRTVWVHPEATQEKWSQDFYLCRFGAKPPTAEDLQDADRPVLVPRSDWKHCLATLGWTTRVRPRSSPPFSTPDPPPSQSSNPHSRNTRRR